MLAITLSQPWASLVVAGQVRAIPVPHRIDEPPPVELAIVAARSFRRTALEASLHTHVLRALLALGLSNIDSIPRGAVVGVVRIVKTKKLTADAERIDEGRFRIVTVAGEAEISAAEFMVGEWRAGCHAWLIGEHIAFSDPVPSRGARGVRPLPPHIAKQVVARLPQEVR